MLAGCSAGFLNVAKIKGSHNAIKTGMLAAEEIFTQFKEKGGEIGGFDFSGYQTKYEKSWVHDELY